MKIWDRGDYELLNVEPTDEGIAKGELKIILNGSRVRGEWHLVKTKRSERDWLFFKSRDAYARVAIGARDEHACRAFKETAELVWLFDKHTPALDRMSMDGGELHLVEVNGRIVIPIRADHLVWSADLEQRVERAPPGPERLLWASGTVSGRARAELAGRGVEVRDRVFARYGDKIDVARVLLPDRVESAQAGSGENQTQKLVDDVGEGVKKVFGSFGDLLGSGESKE